MSTLTIPLPAGAARQLRECAHHATREDFFAFLNGSPGVPPMPGDEL